jgi:hypothetical protein
MLLMPYDERSMDSYAVSQVASNEPLRFKPVERHNSCGVHRVDVDRTRGWSKGPRLFGERQGVKLAAISYDSEEILKFFGDRHKIEYPMLADPDSNLIQAYGVLNTEVTGMQKGFARPGYFYIDSAGVIREKVFRSEIPRATPRQ